MVSRGRPLGFKMSEESKQKISEAKTGQPHSEETKEKISKSVTDYFKTPEGLIQRTKMSDCYTDFWMSPKGHEIREIISAGLKESYKNW